MCAAEGEKQDSMKQDLLLGVGGVDYCPKLPNDIQSRRTIDPAVTIARGRSTCMRPQYLPHLNTCLDFVRTPVAWQDAKSSSTDRAASPAPTKSSQKKRISPKKFRWGPGM